MKLTFLRPGLSNLPCPLLLLHFEKKRERKKNSGIGQRQSFLDITVFADTDTVQIRLIESGAGLSSSITKHL